VFPDLFPSLYSHKCLAAVQLVGEACLVEDTCLQFDALGGMPGPYIKWFLDSMGTAGLVKLLAGFEDKKATALCTMGYCEGPGHPVVIIKGECRGTIVSPRGAGNFGWDPIFQPDEGQGKTFAEMPGEEKNKISHRSKAVKQLIAHLT
jgi:inosine triphosphate pyrophosphatase